MTREEEINKAAEIDFEPESVDMLDELDFHKVYRAGVIWGQSHPLSPWISVKEKLPYNNPNVVHFGFTNRVLVMDKNGHVSLAYMMKNKDNEWIWCYDLDNNFILLPEITHWMYIPDIPNKEINTDVIKKESEFYAQGIIGELSQNIRHLLETAYIAGAKRSMK